MIELSLESESATAFRLNGYSLWWSKIMHRSPATFLQNLLGEDWRNFDPRRIVASDGPIDRFSDLLKIPEIQSPEALIAAWRHPPVSCWPPADRAKVRVKGRPEQLVPLLDAGYALYFKHAERNVPALRPWIRKLASELRVPPKSVYCEAFASRSGYGAKMHFDPNSTFNIQLTGRKKWEISYNQCIEFPHQGWAVGDPIRQDMRAYFSKELPSEMPEDVKIHETPPGSVVYVPHGAWHKTLALEPSFALLFTIAPKSWLELIAETVVRDLRSVETWRERPIGTCSSAFLESKQALLDQLIGSLRRVANDLSVAALEESIGGPYIFSFRVAEGLKLGVSSRQIGGSEAWFLDFFGDGRKASRTIDPEVATVLDWAIRQDGWFTGEQASNALMEIDSANVLEIIAEFHSIGFFQRRRTAPS